MNEVTQGYILAVEWDGSTPPTTWYSRLHKLGLRVRGDKETSVITRRYSETSKSAGVIFQEGMVLCSSERAVNMLAAIAKDLGAVNVMVGSIDVSQYVGSEQDRQTLAKISSVFGKRGPKFDANAGTYSVTCLDEGTTHEIDLRDVPVLCPVCSSDHFTYRLGNRTVQEVTLDLDGWYFSRFHSGHFEVPIVRIDAQGNSAKCPDNDFQNLACKMLNKVELRYLTASQDCFKFLDALWIAYTSDPQTRRSRRLAILNRYFSQGGSTPYLMISREIDIVDVAAIPCAQSLNLL